MAQGAGSIRNIEAGQPFARTLARFLLQETQGRPEELTRYCVLLPTRRACRVLRESFLRETGGKPLLLPAMTPLGDVEEDDLALMMFGRDEAILDVKRAMSPLRRQVLLARLIMAMPGFAQGYEHALALAAALAGFLDHAIIEELDFGALEDLVPEEFAAHWQITLDFLKIVTQLWPGVLAEYDAVDAAQRRNLLLQALAGHWRAHPPDGPVIAAGSTGSVPATAELLAAIAALPQGMIVLPGLDTRMDEESWTCMAPTHPQYGLKKLLGRLGASRGSVTPLDGYGAVDHHRAVLATEVMRPAATSAAWKDFGRQDTAKMLRGLQYYPCDTQQEEAGVIAVIIREALETPGKTVALVTPDRGLARRVAAACGRWGIAVDDSAGQPLTQTQAGKFLLLLLEAGGRDYDPVALLALLKHPHCGSDPAALAKLEKDILRQDARPRSLAELDAIAAAHPDPKVGALAQRCLAGLSIMQGGEEAADFSLILDAHLRAAEFFAGNAQPWRGEDGHAAAAFFGDLQDQASLIGAVTPEDYAGIFASLARGVTVRPSYGLHPRVSILGQLEARLTDADLVVLGGLNEGIWPPSPAHDPWMSRPMRESFGLPPHERAVGMAAHDFVQGFCAGDVVMTRARRVDGTPGVPSRWLERLDTVLRACGQSLDDLSPGAYVDWAARLDDSGAAAPCERPAPKPPLAARPARVSVTRVETWLKDPYAIYARYVLNLHKIRPLVQESDAALRGQVLHKILEDFVRENPLVLPEDAFARLSAHAREALSAVQQRPEDMNFWWPRYERLCAWFLQQEAQWRERAKFLGAEMKGEMTLSVDGRDFTLHGVVDRIDRMAGGYAVIDYKTGGNFSPKALKEGKLPQLPLEALMLRKGRFDGVEPGPCAYLGYWKLTGGRTEGEIRAVEGDIDDIVQNIEEELRALVSMFYDPETPFLCIPDPANAPRFNDYAHLERVKEWAALDEENEEAA